jgi:DNA-binding NarL/FixJ family response regulator
MTSGRPARALSEEECVVLGLSATGLTTEEVADTLGVSAVEVRGRLNEALVALGARSKLEAVVFAARDGLIELP